MSCKFCTDPDGNPCFPVYGIAPHTHNFNKTGSFIGSTEMVTGETIPDDFTPDRDDTRMGIWSCPHCGDGKQKELKEDLSTIPLCEKCGCSGNLSCEKSDPPHGDCTLNQAMECPCCSS